MKFLIISTKMGVSGNHKQYADCYFLASGLAACINFPLWKASTIGQSGYEINSNRGVIGKYVEAMKPPYKGLLSTILGMTWARAAIFYGSDAGKSVMLNAGMPQSISIFLPPMVVSTIVQFVNMPIVRATITLQDPQSKINNVSAAIRFIYLHKGLKGLWHGTSAGVLKTVPKYCTAVIVKDLMEEILEPAELDELGRPIRLHELSRSAIKSTVAGLAGAVLTNPLDVLRNEMFKTDLGIFDTVTKLKSDYNGWGWLARGMGKNMVAVAIPVASAIFFTDALINAKTQHT